MIDEFVLTVFWALLAFVLIALFDAPRGQPLPAFVCPVSILLLSKKSIVHFESSIQHLINNLHSICHLLFKWWNIAVNFQRFVCNSQHLFIWEILFLFLVKMMRVVRQHWVKLYCRKQSVYYYVRWFDVDSARVRLLRISYSTTWMFNQMKPNRVFF